MLLLRACLHIGQLASWRWEHFELLTEHNVSDTYGLIYPDTQTIAADRVTALKGMLGLITVLNRSETHGHDVVRDRARAVVNIPAQ